MKNWAIITWRITVFVLTFFVILQLRAVSKDLRDLKDATDSVRHEVILQNRLTDIRVKGAEVRSRSECAEAIRIAGK
jgi:hypothetical protein